MSAKDDAVVLGWARDPAGPFGGVNWRNEHGHCLVFSSDGRWYWQNANRDSEDAALEAAISATPNARALLEARREIARLRGLLTGETARAERYRALLEEWQPMIDAVVVERHIRGVRRLADDIGALTAELRAERLADEAALSPTEGQPARRGGEG